MKEIKNLKGYLTLKNGTLPEYHGMSNEDQLAFISHYLLNLGKPEAEAYLLGKTLFNNMLGRDPETPVTESDRNYFYQGMSFKFEPKSDARYTFIDLFAGIGGFRLAMQSHGGRCVFSSEFNPNAQKTYSNNYGEVPFGDITKPETKNAIPKEFDIVCGGFPCQAFSIAGYRKGFEDARGTLFFDVAQIIKDHQPKVAYLENVKNLESHDNGKTFEVIKNTLEELGYAVYYKVLKASQYGNIPQSRERILIVAFNKGKVINHESFRFPDPIPLTKTIHDCITPGKQEERFYYREGQIYYPKLIEGMTSRDSIYQWRRIYVRENKTNLCPTLTANMGGGGHNVPLILTDDGIRKLTPRECLNFMGYPEQYEYPNSISESAKYMQAGNSVVVPMMTRVAEQIVRVLDENK